MSNSIIKRCCFSLTVLHLTAGVSLAHGLAALEVLPGTRPLVAEGDLAAQMVAGIDRFLMRELADSAAKRERSGNATPLPPRGTWNRSRPIGPD